MGKEEYAGGDYCVVVCDTCFCIRGVAKLMEFDVFEAQLEESPVPEPVASIVAWGLPITEFILCILWSLPAIGD